MESVVTNLTESMDNSFMEEVFYKWWEDVMGLFSAERRNEFEKTLSIQEGRFYPIWSPFPPEGFETLEQAKQFGQGEFEEDVMEVLNETVAEWGQP
jgi:hypothetical protein